MEGLMNCLRSKPFALALIFSLSACGVKHEQPDAPDDMPASADSSIAGAFRGTFAATMDAGMQKCDKFSNFDEKTVLKDGQRPSYKDVSLVSNACLDASRDIRSNEIIGINDKYEVSSLKIMKQICSNSYNLRASALRSLANARYSLGDSEVYKNNQLVIYRQQNAEAMQGITACKAELKSFKAQWGITEVR